MHSEAAHELLDRVEVETVKFVNVSDDGKIQEKDREIADLKMQVSKLEDQLKEALSGNQKKTQKDTAEVAKMYELD